MIDDRWEMGSSFHECSGPKLAKKKYESLLVNAELYLSGRHALLDLVLFQYKYHDLTKIFIPAYYCHDITHLISKIVEVEIYSCDPLSTTDLSIFPDGSVVILVEYFGNKAKIAGCKKELLLILDKTHNPFSNYNYDFTINYTFGSLRKVLPLSDGGFLIPPVLVSHLNLLESASEVKEAQKAMQLKQFFLAGYDVDKKAFLKSYSRFEEFLNFNENVFPISAESYKNIFSFNYRKILLVKKNNLNYLNTYYKMKKKVNLFLNDCYFSFFIKPESIIEFKTALIKAKVYPVILWPAYNGDYNLINDCILVSLHADFRYSIDDMKILINILDGIFGEL